MPLAVNRGHQQEKSPRSSLIKVPCCNWSHPRKALQLSIQKLSPKTQKRKNNLGFEGLIFLLLKCTKTLPSTIDPFLHTIATAEGGGSSFRTK